LDFAAAPAFAAPDPAFLAAAAAYEVCQEIWHKSVGCQTLDAAAFCAAAAFIEYNFSI
jgi:hypothetical protein